MKPENSILNVEVSCFKNYNSAHPKPVNLLTWLTSDKYHSEAEQIRTLPKKERDKIKSTLPAITPSGLFSYRSNDKLVKHSGLVCIDIDLKGNERVGNYDQIKQLLSNVPFIAFVGLSVSATGYFALVPIPKVVDNASHKRYFNALKQDFESAGLKIDATPDVNRLRGYSFDPDAYFNHSAETYTRKVIEEPKTKQPGTKPQTTRKSFFKNNSNTDTYKSTVDDFNEKADTIAMLKDEGYEILINYRQYDKERIYFKRPKATSEYSGNYHIDKKILRVWSDSTPDNFDVDKSYSPFMVFAQLYHSGYTKEAFNDLFDKGYGGDKFRERVIINRDSKEMDRFDYNIISVPTPELIDTSTGEVFDYPPDWDEVPEPDEGTAEYNEMIRLIESEFDAVIDHSVSPEEIEASWIARDNQTPVKAWND